jgi:methylated-DNA-[protein]-cysteine S-methyltransferase
MPAATPFTVASDAVSLAVTVAGGAITSIELNQRGGRGPETPVEREAATQLAEYLVGRRTEFTVPLKPEGTAFDHRVWDAVAAIPYGETVTYGEIARALGNPKGARAVGTANGRNPIPIIIPCHRVVAAGGRLGGYGGGLPLKRRLLDLETRGRLSQPL